MTKLMRAKMVRAKLGNITSSQLKRLADSGALDRVVLPGKRYPLYKAEQVEKLAVTFQEYEILAESEEYHAQES